MMPLTLRPWPELLTRNVAAVGDKYGPNSVAVVNAFFVLSETPWLERVGTLGKQHIAAQPDVGGAAILESWDQALTIFADPVRYNVNGLLRAPCLRCDGILGQAPERLSFWQEAREDAKRYLVLSGIPDALPQASQDLVFEYLYEFVSMLLVEIIASPEARCEYFRQQLSWFRAGYLPCGWVGEWPSGHMRIY